MNGTDEWNSRLCLDYQKLFVPGLSEAVCAWVIRSCLCLGYQKLLVPELSEAVCA
jgi:hypothetical protein